MVQITTSYKYICDNCGISFRKPDKRKHKYCSGDCQDEARGKREERKIAKRGLVLKGNFERFHKRNPHIYNLVVRTAQLLKMDDHHYGIKAIMENLRGLQDFKFSNNYTSFYARLIMAQEKDLNGYFKIRGEKK